MHSLIPTKNYTLVDSILNDPELLERISGAIVPKKFETPRSDGVHYLLAQYDRIPMGVFIVHRDGPLSNKIHANILKQHRKEHSEVFSNLAVAWVWENLKQDKLHCEIPIIYPGVMRRAELSGFKLEGVRTKSYLKNGAAFDLMLYGMERPHGLG